MTGEEIVISGISGVFPNSNDVVEFMDNLYNKVDMVGNSSSRWFFKHPDLPKCTGITNGLEKFDAQFFMINNKQAKVMEPMSRKLLEHAYGAIYDAGVNPDSLKNSHVGIFITSSLTGSDQILLYTALENSGLALPGTVDAMYANRISYWLDSKAPSYTTDLSCTSALICLQHACRSIQAGECEAAIVGGANFCNNPVMSVNLRRFGLLCLDGKTKCFDKNGSGYVRSDAVNVFFLQKAKHAKRIYCEVYNVQGCYTNSPNDNFLPIREVDYMKTYLEGFYFNIGIDPNSVEYVECSAAGIPDADSNELEAIGRVYGRKNPIKVGSVKSNMGSSENASGMCSLTKLCLAYHTGQLAANLHYNDSLDIPSVYDGKVQVLTDNADFNRGFTALNSFSISGATYHALLKGHYKEKNIDHYKTDIPYLILTSGRQETWMERQLNLLKYNHLDPELIGLLHNIYQTDIPGHVYRGYAILCSDYRGRTLNLAQSSAYYNKKPGPVVFVYSGIGLSWPTLSLKLMNIPIIAQSIRRSHKILESKGFDLMSLLTDGDANSNVDIMDMMIGVSAMQIALTDLLYQMGICPDFIIGHGMGDILCGYADGSLTVEQILISNYIRCNIWNDINFMPRAILDIGLGYEKLKRLCPPGIEIIFHNSPESSTISGPCDTTRRFAEELKHCGINVQELYCQNIPFHSAHTARIESLLKTLLEEVIKDPKLRSSKWLSSSVPESSWNTPAAKFSSAEYHSKNLLGPVLFEETVRHIPQNAVIIEIAPHGQLQTILKQTHKEATYISISNSGHNDPVQFLFEAIGKLYEIGLNPNVSVLYPAIEYPVSTTTPLLSHFIEWEHSEDWPTYVYQPQKRIICKAQSFIISIEDNEYKYIQGHVRNGKNIFPEASLLLLVWNTLAMYHKKDYSKLSVVFDKVHFHDEIIIGAKKVLKFHVMISKGSDKFEVTFDNRLVADGAISVNSKIVKVATNISDSSKDILLNKRDVYKLLHLRGYCYKGSFRSIDSTTLPVKNAKVLWVGEWATLLDSLIQLNILAKGHNSESVLKYIHKITIDLEENSKLNEKHEDHVAYYAAQFNEHEGSIRCAGVVMENVLFFDKPVFEGLGTVNDSIKISYTGFPILRSELNGNIIDYSGISKYQGRVMGVAYTTVENNTMLADSDLIWPIPEYWSLEDAATVPVPYLYAFYCLTVKSQLHKYNSVLITDGVKALGQAVISLCLALECTVYTTVSNIEDKLLLLQLFSELKEDNIGNSQDGSFLDMVKYNTKREGCDVVINTFSGKLEKLASQCVKRFGMFLSVVSYDNTQDTDFEMSFLDLDRSYKTVDLPSLFIYNNHEEKKILQRLIGENIAKGVIRPLTRVEYKSADVAETFQLQLSSERDKGRVVVDMIDLDKHIDNTCERIIDFGSGGYYVIVCDESELGIELAEYLMKRGVQKIILHTSMDGFVQSKLRRWQIHNATVEICFNNIETRDECEKLLTMRADGNIEGIFIINNCDCQTVIDNKANSLRSIVEMKNILHNLNAVSKSVCVNLRYYVMVSHTSIDKFENDLISTCDVICEERYKIGIPALHYFVDHLNTFDESNEVKLNVNISKLSDVFKDLEKSIISKEIKTTFTKINDNREHNFVDNVEAELNNHFNMGLGAFFKHIEKNECTGTDVLVNMPTKIPTTVVNKQEFDSNDTYLLMIPGFDGDCQVFKLLCEQLKMPAIALQLTPDLNYDSMETVASNIMQILKTQIKVKSKFYILGYSFGVNVALELAASFEREGHLGVVYCLDSSPDALRIQFQAYVGKVSDVELEDLLLNHMYLLIAKESKEMDFENMKWSEKLKRLLDNLKSIPFSNEYKKLVIESAYKKIMLALSYKPDFKLESELILIKGIRHPKANGLAHDYKLSEYTKNPIKIFEINSDVASIPEDRRIPNFVNRTLDPKLLKKFKRRNLCETYIL